VTGGEREISVWTKSPSRGVNAPPGDACGRRPIAARASTPRCH